MYRVLCDGLPIYDLRDENLVLIDPKLDLEVNKAGSFSFKMPPQHPQYELPQKMLSCIQVFQDEEEVFNGRITECKIDFYNRKHFTCEGQLAYLNDSIQRPAEYHDMTVRGYLESLITSHNEQVKKDRQFKVGIVTVTDNNDSLYRYTNYNSTMKEIKEDLVDDLGGYLRVRNVNGTAYLDYISDYDNVSTQSIEFGENLLDFSRNTDVSDIATVFIPLNKLGATYLKNEEKRELIAENLAGLSECSEVGLGSGKTKKGLKISINTAKEILDLFSIVPQYKTGGFSHFEEIQLYVNNISKDRISDFACNFLKSFLIDFTQDECKKYNIPVREFANIKVFL